MKIENDITSKLAQELLNIITAIEAGISTDILLKCAEKENSYMFQARDALKQYFSIISQ